MTRLAVRSELGIDPCHAPRTIALLVSKERPEEVRRTGLWANQEAAKSII